jgi:murein DD-endopeptidase MepM/ murein hydrolase activator NlpD
MMRFYSAVFIVIAGFASCTAIPSAAVQKPAPSKVAVPPVQTGFWLSRSAAQGALITGRVPDRTTALQLDGQAVQIDDQGYFIIGFDRDAGPSALLVATLESGRRVEQPITVAQTQWSLSYVNTPAYGGAANQADFEARRPAELAQIAKARTASSNSKGWRQKFIWPFEYWKVKGGRISGLFGRQRFYQGKPGSPHGGLDIAAPTGTPFYAPADGVVVLSAKDTPFTLEGHLLIIDHGNGVNSAFLHCSQLLVSEGQMVKQGQLIGKVGNTGRSAGAHLHWGMKWNAARIDPKPLVQAR